MPVDAKTEEAHIFVLIQTAWKARKSKGLERSLKVAIPDEVYENLEKEMSILAE